MDKMQEGNFIINFCTVPKPINSKECTSSPQIWLTVDRTPNDDPYVIKYEFQDKHGNPIRIQCDARVMDINKMAREGNNRPGLGKYAATNERLCNVKFIAKGVGTWGFKVREGLKIKKGDEIFRPF
jgi:hypothetical protein